MKLKYSHILLGLLSFFPFTQGNITPNVSSIQKTETPPTDEALHLFFFNVGQGHCTLLKHGRDALIIDAGSLDKKFSKIKSSFENALGNSTIRAIILTNASKEYSNFLKKLRKHYCQDCTIVNIQNKKIRLFLSKNYCEYLSYTDAKDLQQLSSILDKTYPTLTFKFPVYLKRTNSSKDDSSLTFTIEYQDTKLLFTGDANSSQFNHLVDSKQKYTDLAKKQLIEANTAILGNTKLFRTPALITKQEDIFQWISFLVKNNSSQPVFIIENTSNSIAYPENIKNKLQSINISQETLHLKIEKNSFLKYDFTTKSFHPLL